MKDQNEIRWYVVANRTEAGIYVERDDRSFALIECFYDPEGRLHERALDSDKPGRAVSSASGKVRHALDRRFRRHEHLTLEFAKQIAEYLEIMRQRDRYDSLVLVAEPGFLGILNGELSSRVHARVVAEVNRELVTRPIRELRSRILKEERRYEYRTPR